MNIFHNMNAISGSYSFNRSKKYYSSKNCYKKNNIVNILLSLLINIL